MSILSLLMFVNMSHCYQWALGPRISALMRRDLLAAEIEDQVHEPDDLDIDTFPSLHA